MPMNTTLRSGRPTASQREAGGVDLGEDLGGGERALEAEARGGAEGTQAMAQPTWLDTQKVLRGPLGDEDALDAAGVAQT
jgi:hypothetical protein